MLNGFGEGAMSKTPQKKGTRDVVAGEAPGQKTPSEGHKRRPMEGDRPSSIVVGGEVAWRSRALLRFFALLPKSLGDCASVTPRWRDLS